MSDPLLDKVHHLLRLSVPSTLTNNEHEARAAAVAACRLITEHRLVVARASEMVSTIPAPVRPAGPGRPVDGAAADLKRREELAAKAREILQGGPRRKAPMRPVVMAGPGTTPIAITARFGGTCEDCRKAYAQGAKIWYRRGVGAVHASCHPEALV